MNKKASPQRDSSKIDPMVFVVTEAYQEKISAINIMGKIIFDTKRIFLSLTASPTRCNTIAHWAINPSSATVAIVRPTKILEKNYQT